MRSSTLVGIKVGLLALLAFIILMGTNADVPYSEWLSYTFNGIAFSFAWGLGAPAVLAYILAFVVFAAIFSCGFFLGKTFSRKLDQD